ncbi:MAG TPA: TonB-dependent siderophore receptor [Steroidobacteraceae bacterium]|nr:TonB-dependent siderophore receptor [Steroidobacteraceae bacterium]
MYLMPVDTSDAPSGQPATLPSLEVTGTAIPSGHDTPQSQDSIGKEELAQQNLTLLQEALRNVPGITLNAGEGGAHGDSVNLRGLSIPDSFFLDGVRDIGQYQRDTFNTEAISVLLGPASAVFGRGSTSGVINSISKQPLLTESAALSVSGGQAEYWRGTGDFNLPLSGTAAARLTLMDQRNGVVQRDQVLYRRFGVAPAVALGIGTPTRLTLSYFKEEENNIPDYGIPFIEGAPADVDRNNYYGLVNYDRTRTNTNIGTLRIEHDVAEDITLSDSLRYANYGFEYLVSAPYLGNDYVSPPPPATPYADIGVSRDQPSSAGTTSLAINRTDATAKFDAAGLKHTLTAGLELSREQSNVSRFTNGLNDIAPTPLLNPDPFHTAPTPLTAYSLPKGRGSDVSLYALDGLALGPHWDVDLGWRWDRFNSRFSEAFTGTAFERTDTFVSPRAAVIFKPSEAQSFYLSYGTSYNPVIEYLIVAPSDNSLSPEKNSTVELGAKLKVLDGSVEVTGALFDTRVKNVRLSDPDDPTVQEMPFDQRVKGVEAGINGHVTELWEVTLNYAHLDDKIDAGSNPLWVGKSVPNVPHDAVNFWSTVEPTPAFTIGGGLTAVSHRYADAENTAGVPSYVVFNAMASYQATAHLKLQLNLNNVGDKLYFTGVYYTGTAENHALPSAGRTLIVTATYRF